VIVQDHGGNMIDYGSPNQDREWELEDTSESRVYERKEHLRDEHTNDPDRLSEPIICTNCFAMRRSGSMCPWCGFTAPGRTRMVLQTDGELREVHGKKFRRCPVAPPDQEKLWISCFWGARKNPDRSYAATIGWFGELARLKTGRWVRPHPEWFGMPMHLTDHKLRVADVHVSRIVGMGQEAPAGR
jgi:hypothetical protein